MFTHTARKRLGQNFLVDNFIIAEIIAHISPNKGEHIVEIGPGQGALTRALVRSGAKIDAIELDRDLAAHLAIMFQEQSNFHLHNADILDFELTSIANSKQKLRLVGNLPYNISSPLLFKMFENIDLIQDMYFMLQKEVAERLSAQANSKEYGRMTVMAQYFCDMYIVLDVPPTAFDPAPKVYSAVVKFQPHADIKQRTKNFDLLQKLTTMAFNQRRKTIANSLKELISVEELQSINIAPKLRAENLSLDDYCKITDYLWQHMR